MLKKILLVSFISVISLQFFGCSESVASIISNDKDFEVQETPTINQACATRIINDIVGVKAGQKYDSTRSAKQEILKYCTTGTGKYTAANW